MFDVSIKHANAYSSVKANVREQITHTVLSGVHLTIRMPLTPAIFSDIIMPLTMAEI